MTSKIISGHSKNVVNFEALFSYCLSYGAKYNPSNRKLTIAELQKKHEQASDILVSLKNTKKNLDVAIQERKVSFNDLKPFATKITNAFACSGVAKTDITTVKILNKKIQGLSIRDAQNSISNEINFDKSSQQSYAKKLEYFKYLYDVLEKNQSYNPNELNLKTDAVLEKLQNIEIKNRNLLEIYQEYKILIQTRDLFFYDPDSGLVQKAKKVKQYVKSAFGTKSDEYMRIKSLEFKSRKIN